MVKAAGHAVVDGAVDCRGRGRNAGDIAIVGAIVGQTGHVRAAR